MTLGDSGSGNTINVGVQNFVGDASISGAVSKTGLTLNTSNQSPDLAEALYSASSDVASVGTYNDGVQDIVINETITVSDARGRSVALTYANGASCTIKMVRTLSFSAGADTANVTRVTLTEAQMAGNKTIPFLTYVYNGGAVVDSQGGNATGNRKNITVEVFPDSTSSTVAPHLTFAHTQSAAHNTPVTCSLAYGGPVKTNQIMRAVFSFAAIDAENSHRLTQISTQTKFFYFAGALPSVRFREITSGTGHHVQKNRADGTTLTQTVASVDDVGKTVTTASVIASNLYVGMDISIDCVCANVRCGVHR